MLIIKLLLFYANPDNYPYLVPLLDTYKGWKLCTSHEVTVYTIPYFLYKTFRILKENLYLVAVTSQIIEKLFLDKNINIQDKLSYIESQEEVS